MPPDQPRGTVRLAMQGLVALRPRGGLPDPELRALHIGVIVSNRSDDTWKLDPHAQRVELVERPLVDSVIGTTIDLAPANVVEVPPRSKRHVDLYFPLPRAQRDSGELPRFDVVLRVNIGDRTIARRTIFERFPEDPPLTDHELVLAPPPGGPDLEE